MKIIVRGVILGLVMLASLPARPSQLEITSGSRAPVSALELAGSRATASIIVGDEEEEVVKRAAALFADDVERVTGRRPTVSSRAEGAQAIIVGTLGTSPLIRQLVDSKRLQQVDAVRGRWEHTLVQLVDNPLPGMKRALVIVGSDRRGTAYGLMNLSRDIGVSPWYWWADVAVAKRSTLYVSARAPLVDSPAVQYRGIFINDEDWGLNQWARRTLDPELGNIGPRTYEKVFELMLRLRLNYVWPAMHEVSTEFGSIAGNAEMADRYGIVAGSSHCEPMLYNNVHWDEKKQGNWDYAINQQAIHEAWQKTVAERGAKEAVWTLGIRGIHDRPMQGPRDIPTRIATMSGVFRDQYALLNGQVTGKWGPVAKIFVPYKEVLPIYDSGLEVPPDATLVWVDDNFGYIRRLSSPAERQRPGGAGVYWHLSYYGGPHSYTWLNTTAPALMWEQFQKAWNNDARRVWVINVGDIKPMELGIDYFSRLAWAPEKMGPDSQPEFLREFAAQNFGKSAVAEMTGLLAQYYHLGTIRKPELMNRAWALSLSAERAAELRKGYQLLLEREAKLRRAMPAAQHDSYVEMVGYPARVLALTGLVFMTDRDIRMGVDAAASGQQLAGLRQQLQEQVDEFNLKLAGGKWRYMMPGLETARDVTSWASQVRWPWGEKTDAPAAAASQPAESGWRDAAMFDRRGDAQAATWHEVTGLGTSARAMVLASAASSHDDHATRPFLEYRFRSSPDTRELFIDFLPAFRLWPGMKLEVAISFDGAAPRIFEVPGSSGTEDENGTIRSDAVQNNYVRLAVPVNALPSGPHTMRIAAIQAGVVIDRVWLPPGTRPARR